jgi:hypothetical protein
MAHFGWNWLSIEKQKVSNIREVASKSISMLNSAGLDQSQPIIANEHAFVNTEKTDHSDFAGLWINRNPSSPTTLLTEKMVNPNSKTQSGNRRKVTSVSGITSNLF